MPCEELIRFVRSPDGDVVPDLKAALPGRGAWVEAKRKSVAGTTSRLFSRAFRAQVSVPDDLAGRVEELLKRAALGRLGLARKAGQAIGGFTAVEAALASGKARALIQAADAAQDGRRKMSAAMRRGGATTETFDRFSSGELGLALGRSHAIHAAALEGAAARSFILAARRLEAYAGESDDETGLSPTTMNDTARDGTGRSAGRTE